MKDARMPDTSLPARVSTFLGLGLLLGATALAAQQPAAAAVSGQQPAAAARQPAAATAMPPVADTADRAEIPAPGSVKNPYTGNTERIAEGKKIWFRMSCYACHGTLGGGGMGPNLTDAEWRYGGDDTSVFTTIKFGRPGGMPAWGSKLTADQIYEVMAYVRSLYRGDAAHVEW
jgi:cytochrome c(L)